MTIEKIYIGGWFQRTTLHLTEVWDFLKSGKTKVELDSQKLNAFREALNIETLSREADYLEYVNVISKDKISYRIYEDGLIILEKNFENLDSDFDTIRQYYEEKLSKSLSYLFSRGAPVPKELANIKTILPYIVLAKDGPKEKIKKIFNDRNEEIYSELSTDQTEVYRSPEMIFINNLNDEALAKEIIEAEIFFREFKSQLHRYLTIHRIVWEKIEKLKEAKSIRGTDIENLRAEISTYQKTINLIKARIEQMDTYIKTRERITSLEKIDEKLKPLFSFKFETLQDTHEYIKDLWEMTSNYLDSAIEMLNELQEESTKNSISSLQYVTSIGVVSGIIGYLGSEKLPKFTYSGIFYFLLLLIMSILINWIILKVYKSKKYEVSSSDINKDIK